MGTREIVIIIVLLGILVGLFYGNVKLYHTMGLPRMAVFIPVWGPYVAFEVLGINPLVALIDLVPYINILLRAFLSAKIAEAFGKNGSFIIFSAIFGSIALAYLGYTEDTFYPPGDPESPSQDLLG
jgi:hypothetical protein